MTAKRKKHPISKLSALLKSGAEKKFLTGGFIENENAVFSCISGKKVLKFSGDYMKGKRIWISEKF